ncbi:hypothetical protein GCM10017764_15450 [Sphingobacterium griseoflavum]|uniref:Calcineurin-like phosphoesterase domain-containing protein n=2 Tax=Sphingobacterium griseoflavum TaxID=1474952 RepID=A0ABQ3HWK7_9SPHI|nr:hypothetical protein GCM10017764_15450 [Sphingobacterium griseoflavum]
MYRLLTGFGERSIVVAALVLIVAALVLISMLFGITRGKYHYKVRKETLYFSDLPADFDGFTITQLSDIHAGSLGSKRAVQQGITLANQQRSDLLLFTGDLVNHTAAEMEPWKDVFSQLKAPYGKYAILGNHDYGDYMQWESHAAKAFNLHQLEQVHAEMGFSLLRNKAVQLVKDNARITLIGVENWGKGGFQRYGDLQKATENIADDSFRILMSHDPSHWEEQVLPYRSPVQLTLSGHTHGMQFGIDLGFFKWSPIQYFYKEWAGLYQRHGKYLYVNRGFGFHGLQGRIGIWPEITVLTLKRSES